MPNRLSRKVGGERFVSTPSGWDAVKACCYGSNIEMLQRLLESGHSIESCNPNALKVAVENSENSTPLVRLLLKHGADVNSRSNECNVLRLALRNGSKFSTIKMLVQAGSSLDNILTSAFQGYKKHREPEELTMLLIYLVGCGASCNCSHDESKELVEEYGERLSYEKEQRNQLLQDFFSRYMGEGYSDLKDMIRHCFFSSGISCVFSIIG